MLTLEQVKLSAKHRLIVTRECYRYNKDTLFYGEKERITRKLVDPESSLKAVVSPGLTPHFVIQGYTEQGLPFYIAATQFEEDTHEDYFPLAAKRILARIHELVDDLIVKKKAETAVTNFLGSLRRKGDHSILQDVSIALIYEVDGNHCCTGSTSPDVAFSILQTTEQSAYSTPCHEPSNNLPDEGFKYFNLPFAPTDRLQVKTAGIEGQVPVPNEELQNTIVTLFALQEDLIIHSPRILFKPRSKLDAQKENPVCCALL